MLHDDYENGDTLIDSYWKYDNDRSVYIEVETYLEKRDHEPTFEEIKQLRSEIVLGSDYYTDYENSLGFDEHEVSDFFDGYLDFLQSNYEEDHDGEYPDDVFDLESDEELECWLECWLCGIETFTQYYENKVVTEYEDEDAEDDESEEVA